jgi:two-component system OmpR family response regulator
VSALQVLYVDDEPDIREIAAIALGLDPGIGVRVADSGEQALATIGAEGWWPDVILLDVMMPGMDGPAVLAAIAQAPRSASIPIVFITARTQSQDRARLLQLGAIGVIGKPFDPMTLAKELRAVLSAERVS